MGENKELPGELWLPAVGWGDCYEVSDLGRVWSVERLITDTLGRKRMFGGSLLAPCPDRDGYALITLCRNSKPRQRFVHRLVLEAFVGPCPPGMEACHGPAGKTGNSLSNLRWDTDKANAQDCLRDGGNYQAAKTHCDSRHEFTPENTYVDLQGCRHCRACRRASDKRRYRPRVPLAS